MLIDWHSHHTSVEVSERLAQAGGRSARPDPQDSSDFGKRVGDMDEAGIDFQLVSQGGGLNADSLPGDIAMGVVRASNDIVAERVSRYPDRLAGSVAVTYADPEGSAAEISRMTGSGFRAVMLYANGDLATKPASEVIFARAHDLGLPIFLHGGGAGVATPAGVERLEDDGRGVMVSSGGDAAVANCVMQMIASGLFDRYPELRVVIRSGGGGVPLLQTKMWWTHVGPSGSQPYSEIFREHFLVDTANVDGNTVSALVLLMGDDGVVFGSDYGGGLGLLRDAVERVDAQQSPGQFRAAVERNSRLLLHL